MSVAKVKQVKAARKAPGKCRKCGKELGVGDPYLWYKVGFRSRFKQVRCTDKNCYPRPSERESSQVTSVMAAQESFFDQIHGVTDLEDIEPLVAEVADACRSLADDYQSGLDAWEHGNEMLQEKVDHWNEQADELESFSLESDDLEECLEQAQQAVDNIDFG